MCNLNEEYISVPNEESYFFFKSNSSNFYTSIEYNEMKQNLDLLLFYLRRDLK